MRHLDTDETCLHHLCDTCENEKHSVHHSKCKECTTGKYCNWEPKVDPVIPTEEKRIESDLEILGPAAIPEKESN